MKSKLVLLSLCRCLLGCCLLGFLQPLVAQQSLATSAKNMIATVHPLATRAGLTTFEEGGNAIDAAIAAGLTLGVVDGFNSGIGGGCFILIRTAAGEVVAIDGREMAPASAHRDMYLRDGKPDTSLSQTGPLAIGVPGALAAYNQAVTEYGQLQFKQLIQPAAKIAGEGFTVGDLYAGRVASVAEHLSRFSGSAEILLRTDGSPIGSGDRLVQTDLARTYQMIGEKGPDYFYRGEFAQTVAKWMKENGGLIDEKDFVNYTTKKREPIVSEYRGVQIIGFPPPSSGGVHVAQILNILSQFDLAELYSQDQSAFYHVIAEAMKLGFADRAYWLGDPDFANVPRGLIDVEYARTLAGKINPAKAIQVPAHGIPPDAETRFFEKHTTHISAADGDGNFVAITTTVNTTFGSKVIVPKTGVILNNQMDDFSISPGTPNAFGLMGSDANSIAPGKRPLSSMSPTIVLKDGQPVMSVGAAGGPRIITQVVHAIVHYFDLGMEIDEAVAAPRIHHQWSPNRLYLEQKFGEAMARELQQLGHETNLTTTAGVMQAIVFDVESGLFKGTADPRARGVAAGQ